VLRDPKQAARHGRSHPIISSVVLKENRKFDFNRPFLSTKNCNMVDNGKVPGWLIDLPAPHVRNGAGGGQTEPAGLTTTRWEKEWRKRSSANEQRRVESHPAAFRLPAMYPNLNYRPMREPRQRTPQRSSTAGPEPTLAISLHPSRPAFPPAAPPPLGQSCSTSRCRNAAGQRGHWSRRRFLDGGTRAPPAARPMACFPRGNTRRPPLVQCTSRLFAPGLPRREGNPGVCLLSDASDRHGIYIYTYISTNVKTEWYRSHFFLATQHTRTYQTIPVAHDTYIS
jgi:hypothetical protein